MYLLAMERSMLIEHLGQADAHVKLGDQHITDQLARIDRLLTLGLDAWEPRDLLRLFRELQVEHVAHRDRLRESIEKNITLSPIKRSVSRRE